MATLQITVTTNRMPHTSEFWAVVKGIERFYYALLCSTEPASANNAEVWVSWLEQGFNAAIKAPPPLVRDEDRLHTMVDSDSKITRITETAANAGLIARLRSILQAIDPGRT